jgi:hypothetical protein
MDVGQLNPRSRSLDEFRFQDSAVGKTFGRNAKTGLIVYEIVSEVEKELPKEIQMLILSP